MSQTTDGGADASTDGGARVPKLHRASGEACPQARGAGTTIDGGLGGTCFTDSDCIQGTNGRCLPHVGGPLSYDCSYDTCFADSDCASNVPCECRASASDNSPNYCVAQSDCKVDADCGVGGYCSPSGIVSQDDCGLGYHCHTPADTCIDDSDCSTQNPVCIFDDTTKHWGCNHPCYPPP